jgi:hypothetical protein
MQQKCKSSGEHREDKLFCALLSEGKNWFIKDIIVLVYEYARPEFHPSSLTCFQTFRPKALINVHTGISLASFPFWITLRTRNDQPLLEIHNVNSGICEMSESFSTPVEDACICDGKLLLLTSEKYRFYSIPELQHLWSIPFPALHIHAGFFVSRPHQNAIAVTALIPWNDSSLFFSVLGQSRVEQRDKTRYSYSTSLISSNMNCTRFHWLESHIELLGFFKDDPLPDQVVRVIRTLQHPENKNAEDCCVCPEESLLQSSLHPRTVHTYRCGISWRIKLARGSSVVTSILSIESTQNGFSQERKITLTSERHKRGKFVRD